MAVSRLLPYTEREVTNFAVKPPCACEGATRGVQPTVSQGTFLALSEMRHCSAIVGMPELCWPHPGRLGIAVSSELISLDISLDIFVASIYQKACANLGMPSETMCSRLSLHCMTCFSHWAPRFILARLD